MLHQAVLSFVAGLDSSDLEVVSSLRSLATVIEQNMDGTSGIIISIFVNALVAGLSDQCDDAAASALTTYKMAAAAALALKVLEQATPARPGDRTLMDALTPFVETLQSSGDVTQASSAARVGADGTKGMTPSLGRSVYVNADVYGKVPDAGAIGIAEFVEGLARGLKQRGEQN
jgi:dihydroxyacetone kinase